MIGGKGADEFEASRRGALELLAVSPEWLHRGLMLANGIPVELLVELVRAGLASATAERIRMGPREIKVARVRITAAGRKVLANEQRR
jgi:hypothetical protein